MAQKIIIKNYSFFRTLVQTVAGVPNRPKEVTISVTINGYDTLYTSSRSHRRIVNWEPEDYRKLESSFGTSKIKTTQKQRDLGAQQYISRYEAIDICSTSQSSKNSLVFNRCFQENSKNLLSSQMGFLTFRVFPVKI